MACAWAACAWATREGAIDRPGTAGHTSRRVPTGPRTGYLPGGGVQLKVSRRDLLDNKPVFWREPLRNQDPGLSLVPGDHISRLNLCPSITEAAMPLMLTDQGANLLVI